MRRNALALVAVLALTGAACRQDMHDAPRVEAYEAPDACPDGRGTRPLVDEFPFPVTRDVLERGQQRYNAYCTPCHGKTGFGNGMIVQRGLKPPPSFHDDRLRNSPAGYYFDVMTNGFGVMQDYRAQVDVKDRWAIAAYIRALQLSQQAVLADVPHDKVGDLDKPLDAPAAPPAPAHGSGH